jgi:hypothetical protein
MGKMTFEELAKVVADEFRKDLEEGEFEDFEDMRRCYGWSARDVKDEVSAIITSCANDRYDAGKDGDFFMYDDGSMVVIGWEDMTWREFKKLVFKDLK